MSWINVINYKGADVPLRKLYDRIKGPDDQVDNVMLVHSLRPHTLKGHMTLYKSVLHNVNNSLPKWYLEAIGVYVSYLNKCDYCFDHHYEGFKRLYPNNNAQAFKEAVMADQIHDIFDSKFIAGCQYAKALTLTHHEISKSTIHQLRDAGFSDGEILELNQVVSYFNYVNRTVVGLGVNTQGDILGLSPNESADPQDWNHS